MTVFSFCSFKGSPGVTTTVLGLAAGWPRPVLALDLDPQGGDMLVGLGGGRVSAATGIVDVLAESRSGGVASALGQHALRPTGHGPLMVAGFASSRASAAVDWRQLADQLDTFTHADLLVDCGRITPAHPITAILGRSASVLVVTRSQLATVRHVARSAPSLPVPPDRLQLVVVGGGQPYSATEIARACELPVAAVLPDDADGARVWSDGREPGARFHRGKLQRALLLAASRLASSGERGALG